MMTFMVFMQYLILYLSEPKTLLCMLAHFVLQKHLQGNNLQQSKL